MWLRWGGRKLIAESPQPFLCMLQFNNCILTLCFLFLLHLSEVLLHLIARSWRSDVQFPCRKLSSAAAGHAASACSLRRLASLPCLIFADEIAADEIAAMHFTTYMVFSAAVLGRNYSPRKASWPSTCLMVMVRSNPVHLQTRFSDNIFLGCNHFHDWFNSSGAAIFEFGDLFSNREILFTKASSRKNIKGFNSRATWPYASIDVALKPFSWIVHLHVFCFLLSL